MVWPLVAVSAVGAVAGGIGQMQAGKATSKAYEDQSRAQYAVRKEEIRRRTMDIDQTVGRARASGWASGIRANEGSTGQYINDMKAEYQRELQWMQKAAVMERDAIAAGGDALKRGSKYSAIGSTVSGLSNTFSGFM